MKIKELEIAGFKSFYQRTKISFSEGITAIVGPNGCGKSNILDAVRWVIGEHNPRQLRAGGMEDVISNGSAKLKPLGMADVLMVLEGVQGLGFEEVAIRRKLYRSGESEYSINGVKCRLKDITEMLLDTGMGARAYSIVEQGQIDSFIMSRPEEKRKFIEEVAGIEKYKLRRKETRSRIESTKENLDRVLDMKREVSDRIEHLALQAQRAKNYQELAERAKSLEFEILSTKLTDLRRRKDELLEKKLEAERLADSADALKEEKNRLLKSCEEENLNSTSRLSSLEGEVYELSIRKKENEYYRTSVEREIATVQNYAENIEGEVASLSGEVEEMEKRRRDVESRFEELEVARTEASERISREEERLLVLRHDRDSGKKELEKAARELSDVMTRRSSLVSTTGAFSEEIEELCEKKAALSEEISNLRMVKKQQEEQLSSCVSRQDEIKEQFSSAAKEKEKIDSRLYDLRVEHEKKLGELKGLENRKKDCVSRMEALNKIQDSYEWLPEAARKFVLEKKQRGVLGVVSDFVSVPRNYEKAVEAAFGEKLGWIVVEGSTEAVAAVELLREFSAGRGTFIPATDRLCAVNAEVNGHGAVEARLLNNLIDVRVIEKDLVDSMLREVYVASNLEEAVRLKKQTENGACFATLEGDYVDSNGAITGGNSSAGVFERKREIEDLGKQVETLSARIADSSAACHKLRSEMDLLESRQEEVEKLLRRFEISSVENIKDRSNIEAKIEDTSFRMENLVEQMNSAEKKLDGKSRTMDQMESLIKQLDERRNALDSKYDEIESKVLRLAEEESSLQEKITNLRIDKASALEREKALRHEISEVERIKTVINEKLSLREKDMELKERDKEKLRLSLLEAQEKFQKIEKEFGFKRTSLEKLKEEVSLKGQRLVQSREQFESALQTLEARKEKLAAARARLERAEDELRYVNERYQSLFGDEELDFNPKSSGLSVSEAERELKLARRKVENFGAVNLMAPEEYKQLEERSDFLQKQTDDLIDALESLERAIKKLDGESVARFKEAFDTVNKKFGETFRKLFENGEARLELIDPGNLLETGVEVMIRPGGKKFQPINLLSGGEKALSAISVIISACLVKPVPFVFLDEIDAALDEINTERFNKILNEISVSSQVAVITHNKRTMRHANALIGITSDSTATSRVVGVKLDA